MNLKKVSLAVLTAFILLQTLIPTSVVMAADEVKTAITSKMYGDQLERPLAFDSETCKKQFDELYDDIEEVSIQQYKDAAGDSGFNGLTNTMFNIIETLFFSVSTGMQSLIFKGGCIIGIAPSQLIQIVFMPIVLDEFSLIKTMSSLVNTIAIITLLITVSMSILETRKLDGSVSLDLLQKSGYYLTAVGLIAFSTFILQGIFDIANLLNYFVSNYKVNITLVGESGVVGVTVLQILGVFSSVLDSAYSPNNVAEIMSYSGMILLLLAIVKIFFLAYFLKDLLRIAIYGLKRTITLISASVVLPILAALIPSERTRAITYSYFRQVVASAFAPIIFGIIFLASGPFVIENLTSIMQAPFLQLIAIGFFVSVMADIPGFVDGLLGARNEIGSSRVNDRNVRGLSPKGTHKSVQSYNRSTRERKGIDAKEGTRYNPVKGARHHAGKSFKSFVYGDKK